MDKSAAIAEYLARTGKLGSQVRVDFLAAGEYNENYLVRTGRSDYVFRLNHGSQLGLSNQIEYEFAVLEAAAPSGVTPRPLFCDPRPEGLPSGVLVMEYLPGGPLDYRRDLEKAARVLARVHALAPPAGLLVQPDPIRDIAAESLGLLSRHPDHPRPDLRERLEAYHRKIMDLSREHGPSFAAEPRVLVNTEVNSGNFLVDGDHAYLVDWEKAVVSSRFQDLGHFLVATTTRWKTDVTLTREEKRRFLASYRAEGLALGGAPPDLDELEVKTSLLERTILLRALSWCFMAYHEYTRTDRPLKNRDAFLKIKQYLAESECFLK
ncbi:MAG: aminoglycoside phosphotransferase family protein [Pseudomonadota bacterium]